jgi:hypothetical protein
MGWTVRVHHEAYEHLWDVNLPDSEGAVGLVQRIFGGPNDVRIEPVGEVSTLDLIDFGVIPGEARPRR